MKTILIATSVVCLFSQSCTIADYTNAKGKVHRVEQLVHTGDNIRAARRKLIANNFNPSEIHFGSITKQSHYFTLRVSEPTQLDYFGYAADVNLNPWRNGVPSHMVFRSGLDEIIYRIETK